MASWETAMKVDPVSYASFGFYSEVFGLGEEGNRANLFSSVGLLEDAPNATAVVRHWFLGGITNWFRG